LELPVRPINHSNLWGKLPDGDKELWRAHEYGDDDQKYELISGKLVPRYISDFRHQSVTFSLIHFTIKEHLESLGDTEKWFFAERAPLALGDDIIVADLAVWHCMEAPSLEALGWFREAPDLVCLNTHHSYKDYLPVTRKVLLRRSGILHLWDVDVSSKEIKAYRLKNGQWRKAGGMMARGKFKAQPFPDLKFQPENLWR